MEVDPDNAEVSAAPDAGCIAQLTSKVMEQGKLIESLQGQIAAQNQRMAKNEQMIREFFNRALKNIGDVFAGPSPPFKSAITPVTPAPKRRRTNPICSTPSSTMAAAAGILSPACESSLAGLRIRSHNIRQQQQVVVRMEEFSIPGKESKGDFTIMDCRSIRIGSYKVATPENGQQRAAFTPIGILISIPHCVATNAVVKIPFPRDTIVNVQVCYKRMYCLFITTSAEHAKCIRKQLEMGSNVDSDYYFCPLNGRAHQKLVVLLFNRRFNEVERGMLIRTFGKSLIELDYESAHKLLLEANVSETRSRSHTTSPPALPLSPSVNIGTGKVMEPQTHVKPNLTSSS